jgi:predicted RNase H-like HicB family nuclease
MDVRIYRILLKPEPEGGYKVLVPALPGCITYGETIEEARAMATEAIALYVEELQARNEEISDDNDTLEYSILLKTA